MKTILAALAALTFSAGSAAAAVVNFDLTGNASNGPSITVTEGTTTMVVTAAGGDVARTGNGFGVTGTPEASRIGLGESLTFDFGGKTIDSLSGLIFEARGEAEQFGITINGVSTNFTIPAGAGNSVAAIDFSALLPITGISSFTIFGLEPDGAGNRGVKIAGLTVNIVPLPAGGLLLLTALGGLSLRRRR